MPSSAWASGNVSETWYSELHRNQSLEDAVSVIASDSAKYSSRGPILQRLGHTDCAGARSCKLAGSTLDCDVANLFQGQDQPTIHIL